MNVIGSGSGKSGAGGSGISEDPDTLSSVAVARIVDLIGEGPIHGLVNGEYSIYIDGVPLRDLLGTPNYRPFTWSFVPGTQSQLPIPGFSGTEQENAVGLRIYKTMGKVIRSISDATADAVRVTVAVQGLTQTTSEGKVIGSEVRYKIWVRVTGGAWISGYEGMMKGKTGARYQRAHEIRLVDLGPGPYEVAVERLSDEASSSLVINGIYWDAFTIINYELFSYPNSSCVGVSIDGRYFSQVPKREYHVKGLIVRVPANYDTVTRQYATTGAGTTNGGWDGTWKYEYTNNPAWCFYDLLTNSRYGLGSRISDAQVSKWEIYKIAQYCDQLVPSGLSTNVFDYLNSGSVSSSGVARAPVPIAVGGYEPRFTLNVVINTRDDAYRVVNNLSSVFRGMAYWSSGQAMLTQDRPASPAWAWTNANVIDGEFNYEGSGRSQRHTVAIVGWNDPTEGFTQKFEYVEDRTGIERYGVRPIELVAFGCTSRGQARRVGLWLIYTERVEKGAVRFKVGMEGARVLPGETGKVADSFRAGARWGGRVVSSTTSSIALDAPITLSAGTYQLTVMMKDGKLVERSVILGSSGVFTALGVTAPFPDTPTNMAIWTLSSPQLTELLVRVVSVKAESPSVYEITAIEHDPSKYDAIELGLAIEEDPHSLLSLSGVYLVTNLQAIETTHRPDKDVDVEVSVVVSWDSPANAPVRGYLLRAVSSSGNVANLPESSDTSHTFTGVPADTYTVEVRVVDVLGRIHNPVSITVVVTGVDAKGPEDVTGLNGEVVAGGVRLFWDACTAVDYAATKLRVGADWETGEDIFDGAASSTVILSPPPGVYNLWAKHRDRSDNESENAATIVYEVEEVDSIAPPILVITATGIAFITPANSSTPAPANITLTATVKNIPGAVFEWRVDGVVVVGATASTYVLPSFAAGSPKLVRATATGTDGSTAFDVQSIYSLKEGSDAISAGLGNENVSVPCNSSGTPVAGLPIETTMYAARGATILVSPDAVFSVVESKGIESSGVTTGASANVTIDVDTGELTVSQIVSETAYVKVRVTIGSTVIDKVLSIQKVRAGAAGTTLSCEASVGVIKREKDGAHTPTTLGWQIFRVGDSTRTLEAAYWSFYRGTGVGVITWDTPTQGFSSSFTFSGSMVGKTAFKVEVYSDSARTMLVDVVVVPVVVDGVDTLSVFLSNEAHLVPADQSGNVTSWAGAATQIKAFLGSVDVTAACAIAKADTNITTALTGLGTAAPTVTASALSADIGYATITVTYTGYPNMSKVFTVSKARQGATGTGTPGAQGSSARVAYALFTGNPVVSWVSGSTLTKSGATVPSSGDSSPASFSIWASTVPTPSTGQSVMQSQGIYDPVANTTTWSTPFLANFKVGNLSAISADLGTVTAGSITGSANIVISGSAKFDGVNSLLTIPNLGNRITAGAFNANNVGAEVGVWGNSQNASGTSVGVFGSGSSSQSGGTGVRGHGYFGVLGIGTGTAGVYGNVSSGAGAGIFGQSSADPSSAGVRAVSGGGWALDVQGNSTFSGYGVFNGGLSTTSLTAVGAVSFTAGLTTSSLTVNGSTNINGGLAVNAFSCNGLANLVGGVSAPWVQLTQSAFSPGGVSAGFTGTRPSGTPGNQSYFQMRDNLGNWWWIPAWPAF